MALQTSGGEEIESDIISSIFFEDDIPSYWGHIVVAQTNTKIVFVGFLFPRSLEGKTRVYTLRYHALDESEPWKQDTPEKAQQWRSKTDKIFSQLLTGGKCLITNVAHEESRWYLVAQPIH